MTCIDTATTGLALSNQTLA